MPRPDTNTIKNLLLGSVIGITLTAIVVSYQTSQALNQTNQDLLQTIQQLKDAYSATTGTQLLKTDFTLQDLDAVQKTGWKSFNNDAYGFAGSYGPSWSVQEAGSKDCTKAGQGSACYNLLLTKAGSSSQLIVISTSKDSMDLQNLHAFSKTLRLFGKATEFQEFRKDLCVIANGKQTCSADANGLPIYTHYEFSSQGKKLQLILWGSVNLEMAVIVDSLTLH